MNAMELESAVRSLPSYDTWQVKSDELAQAAETRPESIVPKSSSIQALETQIEKLQAEIDYRRAAEEIDLPSAQDFLRVDIAKAQDDIPLPYRLGMLTVIDRPLKEIPNYTEQAVLDLFADPEWPEYTMPPDDWYERAAQIGSVILETADVIGQGELVPLLSTHLSQDPETEEIGYAWGNIFVIENAKGNFVWEPDIEERSDRPARLTYRLPRLTCYRAYLESDTKFATTDSDKRYPQWLAIPQLEILEGRIPSRIDDFKKLFIGEAAVAQVSAQHASVRRCPS